MVSERDPSAEPGCDHEVGVLLRAGEAEVDPRAESEDADESLSDAGLRAAAIDGLVGAWRVDLRSERMWWSPEIYEILGLSSADVSPTYGLVTEMVDAPTAEAIARRRTVIYDAPAPPFAVTCWATRPDGDRRLLQVRGWRPWEDGHQTGQAIGICHDVTGAFAERAERDRLHRRQATILDAAGDGICGIDHDGRIIFTNPAFMRLIRREGDDVLGEALHDLVHREADGRETHPADRCPYRIEEQRSRGLTDAAFQRGDGSRIEVGYMLVAFRDDDERCAVVSFRDMTAHRASARLLQSSLRQVQTLSAQRGALLGHLAEAEERERLRIAAGLHDDTIQALGAVALRLSSAGERLTTDSERDVLADAEAEVRGVAERLRRLMFELMPPEGSGDLCAAVWTYCSTLFADSGIAFELDGEVGELSHARYVVAYRLLQEALRNARAHSHGTRVQVALRETDSELVLRVSDDGVGIDDAGAPPTHAGLRILRRRAQAAGGTVMVGAGLHGDGTAVEIRLPRPDGDRG